MIDISLRDISATRAWARILILKRVFDSRSLYALLHRRTTLPSVENGMFWRMGRWRHDYTYPHALFARGYHSWRTRTFV